MIQQGGLLTEKLDLLDDDVWSDDELDYLENIATKQNLNHGKQLLPSLIKSSKGDKQRGHIFSGDVRMNTTIENTSSLINDFDIPLPQVSRHAYDILGENVINILWAEFLRYDCDESELMLMEHISDVANNMKSLGHHLPFDELNFNPEGDEYVDFTTVVDRLAVARNKPGVVTSVTVKIAQLPPCCATRACSIHSRSEAKVLGEDGDDRPDFRLDVIYRRWVLEKKGIVRVNDIPAILNDADIEHDKSLLSELYWIVHGDQLLLSFGELTDVVDEIRLDREDVDNQLDLYKLPRWLMNEFIPQEVAMFRHHFMMIDVDQGGSIDAEELQLLGESLGNKLSREEAEHLIAEHDDDNSGTIDFAEFMGLMFKILRGTVNVENDKLGKAMMESRSQIKLFQEIENIKENPPENITIKQYGGNPVECEYYLDGPVGSIYEGGRFTFKVVYLNGYPYNCPECFMITRFIGVNMITQTNGYSVLPHVKLLWDTSWDSRRLLSHVLDLMVEPNPSYLNSEMISIVNSFLKENYDFDNDDALLSSMFGDCIVSSGHYQDRLNRLPRLSQMHLNMVALYVTDRGKYEDIVKQYVVKFAEKCSES